MRSNDRLCRRCRGGAGEYLCPPCSQAELATLRERLAVVERERDEALRYRAAMENHLCKYDLADWLACSPGSHGEPLSACEVCKECGEDGEAPQHRHALEADLADTRRKLAGLVAAVDRYVQAGDAADEASMEFAPDDSAEEAVSEAWITLLEALAEVRGAADTAREGGDDGE